MINKRRSQLQPRRWTAAPPVCGSSIYRQRPTGLLQTTIGMSRLLHQSSRDGFPHGNKIRRWIAVEHYSKASNRTFLKMIRPWRIVLRKDIETRDEKGHVSFRQHETDWVFKKKTWNRLRERYGLEGTPRFNSLRDAMRRFINSVRDASAPIAHAATADETLRCPN
jgi:hypothetical protein